LTIAGATIGATQEFFTMSVTVSVLNTAALAVNAAVTVIMYGESVAKLVSVEAATETVNTLVVEGDVGERVIKDDPNAAVTSAYVLSKMMNE
jgi:phage gp45-like